MSLPFTLSSLQLAVECLHSFTIELPPEERRAAAERGTNFHGLAEQTIRFRTPPPGNAALETWWYEVCDDIPVPAFVELAIAWHPTRGARVLGTSIGRAYALFGSQPDDLCGTVDVGWPTDVVNVIDHKTGRRYHAPEDSWQLRGAAVILAEIWQRNTARVAYHYVNESGAVHVESADLSERDLKDARQIMLRVLQDWQRGKTAPEAGDHCDRLYCRARPVCAAYQSIHAKEHVPMAISLASVTRGVVEEPFSVVLYGPEGVGKSTWAAAAPNPIFICEPRGTNRIDTARFPSLRSWDDVKAAVTVLLSEKHDYETVVVDTADWIEGLIWEHVCKAGGKKAISDFGYGKGYDSAREELRWLLARLDELHAKGLHTLVLAHAHIKRFEDPVSEGYDVYELRMNQKAAELLRAWPNAVLFANYRVYLHKNEDDKTRALGDGSRVVYTQPHPARHAKNRYGLPDELPLDWADFETAARTGTPAAAGELEAEIDALIPQLPEQRRAPAAAALKRDAGKPLQLARLKDKILTTIQRNAA